jgi:KaiC/GvpD/RAD55 family RecA-like ATPase
LVVIKKYGTSLRGFEHLEELMGGPIPRGSSLLLMGDPGSGKTVLSYQILHDELEARRPSALLSYDAFPEDVQARMAEFGWDIVSHLRKGRLKIIDCYSGLAGQGDGALRDPSDLTELNIQVTSFITKARNAPVTLVLDSLTPIFNGVDAKQAVNFLQTIGAKVKRTGGIFILTASRGAIPEDSIAKIKSTVDGVIELSVARSGRKATRYLSILKMERRKVAPGMFQFEIDRRLGIMFRVSRFGILRQRVGMLRLRLGIPTEAGQDRAVIPGKTNGKQLEDTKGESKSPEDHGRGVGRRQR